MQVRKQQLELDMEQQTDSKYNHLKHIKVLTLQYINPQTQQYHLEMKLLLR